MSDLISFFRWQECCFHLKCLNTNFVIYDGFTHYHLEVSPSVAHIFLEKFDVCAMLTIMYKIILWKKYVDDTIVFLYTPY